MMVGSHLWVHVANGHGGETYDYNQSLYDMAFAPPNVLAEARSGNPLAVGIHLLCGNVPSGYLSLDCRPLDAASRTYQTVPGPGGGCQVRNVQTLTLSTGSSASAPTARSYRSRRNSILTMATRALRPQIRPTYGQRCDGGEAFTNSQQGACKPSAAIGSQGLEAADDPSGHGTPPSGLEAADDPSGHGTPPSPFTPHPDQLADLRTASETMAAVLFICALGQPLVLAHLNGFTAIGLHASGSARSAMLGQIKALCSVPVTAAHIFMIGQYLAGAELFTAPVDFAPEPHTICRSCAQRVARGTTLAWCTLAALQGTPLSDAATRAFATTEMFRGPSTSLPDAPADGVRFDFEASSAAQSVARRPADERTAPAWSAPQRMLQQDHALVSSLLGSVSSGDSLLDGWAERVQPLDASSGPRELLGHAPSFDVDGIPLSPPPAPLRLPWLPRPPLQKPAAPDPPACPTVLDISHPRRPGLRPSDGSKPLSQTSPLFETSSPPGFPRPASIAPAARPSPSASPRQPSGRATECGTAGANAVCLATSTPLQTLTSTSPTSSAGSATTPTNLWQPISSKGSDSTPMSSCSPCGYLTSPRSPFGYASVGKELRRLRSIGWYEFYSSLPFPAHVPQRPGGDGAQVGAGQAPSAPPLDWVVRVLLQPPFSGSCTSTARGRRRTSWSRTGSGAPPRATDRAPPPSTPPASRPSPHLLGEPTYGFEDDAKDYFNQLVMAPSELHKVGAISLAGPSHLATSAEQPSGADWLVFAS